MIIGATLIILALWMAFIWFVDPDDLRSARRLAKTRKEDALNQCQ